jgi:aryl-alcohol dehydrogenase-like predicted oxidoreductase
MGPTEEKSTGSIRRELCGREVFAIGLGCMNLSHAYGVPPTREAAQSLLHAALDLGIDHFDTAALYGFGRNEELLGEVLAPVRERFLLASKCGLSGVDGKRVIDGRPATLKRTCEEALRRLRTDRIDLYYLHRWDKQLPIVRVQLARLGFPRFLRRRCVARMRCIRSLPSKASIRSGHAIRISAYSMRAVSLASRSWRFLLSVAASLLERCATRVR